MSYTIDERVVAMKFNNGQFESGVKTTLKSLEDLQKGLKLDGARKGLEDLHAAGKKFDLSGIAAGIDGIQAKFSALSVMGIAALSTIAAKATQVGLQLVKNMTIEKPLEGLKEYETQLNAVQTILANTQSKGTTLDQVNEALDTLNTYADKTIYNFTQMTDSIGRFTAAGVDLDTSVTSIKGLSNVAALSGANAQQAATAMYQLSQAIASGTVRLQDWMSIENAGMGGQVFQDSLMETARTHGVAVDDMVAKNGSFRNSLQEGWLTSQIMTETLAKFTGELSDEQLRSMGYTDDQIKAIQKQAQVALDAATKVKTFTQLLDTLAEATVSGWAQSWRIVLGDFEEAKALFTEISDVLGGMINQSAEARNAQLQIWKDNGGREAIIQSLRNAFEAVMQVVKPIGDAFREVFPPTLGNTLTTISFALRDFTESLKIGADASATLHNIALALFKGLKFGTDLASAGFRIFFDGLSLAFDALKALGGLISPLITWLFSFQTGVTKSDTTISSFADTLIELRRAAVEPLIEFIENLGEAFNEFLNGDPSKFGELFQKSLEPLKKLLDNIKSRFSGIVGWFEDVFAPVGERVEMAWENVSNVIQAVWSFIKPLGKAMGEFFKSIGPGFEDAMGNIDWETVLATINTGILIGVFVALKKGIDSVSSIFEGAGSILEGMAGAFEGLTGSLEAMQTKLKAEALKAIAVAIVLLSGGLLLLSLIDPARLLDSVTAMTVMVGVLVGAMTALDRISGDKAVLKMVVIGAAMIQLAAAITIMATAVRILGSMDIWELARGVGAIAVMMGLLIGSAALMSKFEKPMLKTAASLIVFAAALAALAGVVAIFGAMPTDNLIQGGIAIATMMALVVGSAVIVSKFAPKMSAAAGGLMAMAVALGVLAGIVSLFGVLPWDVLLKGFAALGILTAGLVGAGVLLSKFAPQMSVAAAGMLAMAVAINLLVGAILILGVTPWDVVLQGLIAMGIAMGILVVAMNLMQSSMTGAAALIAVSAAILILSFALKTLGSMDLIQLATALGAVVAILVIFGLAAAILGPVVPAMLGIAAAIALLGLGIVAIAGSLMIFSLGLMLLGPALMLATQGLLFFAEASGKIAEAILPMMGIGAALIILGAGAAVAGVGILILGAALIVMGAGLALIGATGLIGATALSAVMLQLVKLVEYVPSMLALGAGFLVLGAGILTLAVALTLVGVATLTFATGLMILGATGEAAIPVLIGLITALLAMIPIALEQFALGIVAFAKVIGDSGPVFVKAVTTLMMSILESIQKVVPEIINTFVVMIQAVLEGLVKAVPMFVDAGMRLIIGVLDGVAKNIGRVISSATDVVVNFINGIGNALPRIIQAGVNLIINFVNGIADAIRNNTDRMNRAGRNLADAIVDGMVSGISNGIDMVIDAAKGIAEGALQAAKDLLGIASPSKEFTKIGRWTTEGFAIGITKNLRMVTRASRGVGSTAIETLKQSMVGISTAASSEMDLQPTIRPVLDLSGVRRDSRLLSGMLPSQSLDLKSTNLKAKQARDAYKAVQMDRAEVAKGSQGRDITYIQNNTSPVALSTTEIYRRTRNQLSVSKGQLVTPS